ncbi:MAG: nitrate/nitrite transporter [Kiloniellaceae bacterium]
MGGTDASSKAAPGGLSGVRLVLALCAAEVACMAGFGSFPALQPTFFAQWRLSNTEAGWINGIYFGAYMASVPVLVGLTDRVDPRRIYLVGAPITALSSLGFALLAEGFWGALVFRGLAGVGLAGTYMPGLKALTDHLPERLRARAVAFYTATFSIGVASSFLLAGEIAAALDWRWAFGLVALGPVIALAILMYLVPPSAPDHLSKPESALLDFRPVVRNRRAFAYVLAYSAHNWELFALRSWIVTFLVFSQALQPDGASGVAWSATALAAAMTILGLPASVLGNEAAQRFGRRRVVIAIMSLSALFALGVGFTAPLPFVLVVGLTFLYNVTVTGDSASITAGALAAAAPGQRGATMAVHSFVGFTGAFMGPLAFGVVLDLAGGGGSQLAWGLAFACSGLAVAMGPLAIATLGRRPAAAAEP